MTSRPEDGLTGIGAGRDASRIEPIVRTVINGAGGWAAVPMACAIEMALWDLAGKRAGMLLHRAWAAATEPSTG